MDLAASQLGLFTRAQATALGADRRRLARRRDTGDLRQLTSRVFAFAGAPTTDAQRVLAAVLHLGPGAAACAWTAAAVWGFPGFRFVPIHVIDARPRRDSVGYHALRIDGRPVVVHTSRYLPDHHLITFDGIPVLTPTRLLFQLAAHLHPGRTARLVDRALSLRLTWGPILHTTLAELAVPGRAGIDCMRGILAERPAEYTPPESGLESRTRALLDEHGFGPYRPQVDLGDDDHWIGRTDFQCVQHPSVILEVQSHLYHSSVSDRAADAARASRFAAAGYDLVEITEHEIWHDPAPGLERLRAAERRAARRLSSAA